jgi:pyruvate kinase
MRRTKIIATVGPATDKPGMIEKLIESGVDLFRINYSHQGHDDHARRVAEIRQASTKLKSEVAIMVDLQGPKIRIEKFIDGKIFLSDGDSFILDTDLASADGNQEKVGVTYKQLAEDVKEGNILLIDDGRVVLKATKVEGTKIYCQVEVGGQLSNSKGINLLGGGLSAGALTDKDREDLLHGVEIGADYFAISFVNNPEDVKLTKSLIKDAGSHASVIAKLERVEAIKPDNAAAIIEVSDAIMIARGDLGVEIGDAALPPVQKRLIRMAREMDTAVITATQMMESMIDHQIPLRAEVFDVANAVLDGTDAVMLSGETSIGLYPDKVVAAMARICEETEKQRETRVSDHRINQRFDAIDEAVAMSTMYAANHIGAKAIASQTETGSTPLWMSRISSGIPIFAFTRHVNTMRKVRLFRGVYPLSFDITHTDPMKANKEIVQHLLSYGYVEENDTVIITKGDLEGETGGTNNMKIVRVGESLEKSY